MVCLLCESKMRAWQSAIEGHIAEEDTLDVCTCIIILLLLLFFLLLLLHCLLLPHSFILLLLQHDLILQSATSKGHKCHRA